MTLHNSQAGIEQTRCCRCSHDLVVRRQGKKQGFVFCSNRNCRHFKEPHATKAELNRGYGVA